MADDRDDQTPQEPTEEPTADREAAEAADAQEPVSETLSGGDEGGEPAAERPVDLRGRALVLEQADAERVGSGVGGSSPTKRRTHELAHNSRKPMLR
jgi:hypothetical protein